MKQAYLECGKIINTHGVRGCVKIESYCDTPDILASLRRIYLKDQNGNFTAREVRTASVGKGKVLATLEGIDDLDTAILYKNTVIYVAREDLPLRPGAHFIADMIGLPVLDADSGQLYGELRMVEAMPSSEMYTVRTPDGKDVLFPAVKEFVDRVDIEKGVFIRPIPGFFD